MKKLLEANRRFKTCLASHSSIFWSRFIGSLLLCYVGVIRTQPACAIVCHGEMKKWTDRYHIFYYAWLHAKLRAWAKEPKWNVILIKNWDHIIIILASHFTCNDKNRIWMAVFCSNKMGVDLEYLLEEPMKYRFTLSDLWRNGWPNAKNISRKYRIILLEQKLLLALFYFNNHSSLFWQFQIVFE